MGDGGAEVGWDNKVAPGIQYSLEEALPLERLRLRTFKVRAPAKFRIESSIN